MASGFSATLKCDSCHKMSNVPAAYRVSNTLNLCNECAEENKDSTRPRERTGIPCHKHENKDARMYCEVHNVRLCFECALASHQTPCKTRAVCDVLDKRKSDLQDLVGKGSTKEDEIKNYDRTIAEGYRQVIDHFHGIEEKANGVIKSHLERAKLERDKTDLFINKEADTKIAEINEEREIKLEQNKQEANEELKRITTEGRHIIADLDCIKKKFQQKNQELNEVSANFNEAFQRIIELARDEIQLLENYPCVAESFLEILSLQVNMNRGDDMSRIAEAVTFEKEDDHSVGRIKFPTEKWMHEDDFPICPDFEMVAIISKEEILVRDVKRGTLYIHDIKENKVRKVHFQKKECDVFSCAILGDGRIVCGTTDGKIELYDEQWTHLLTIYVKGRSRYRIRVSVDAKGRIIAAADMDNTIQFYDPDDGALVASLVNDMSIYEIHPLSTGDLALITDCANGTDVCVLDSEGGVSSCHHLHKKDVKCLAVDRSCDAIYALILDSDRGVYEVTDMSSVKVAIVGVGLIQEFKSRSLNFFIPEPGKLIIYGGASVSVYAKVSLNLDEFLARF